MYNYFISASSFVYNYFISSSSLMHKYFISASSLQFYHGRIHNAIPLLGEYFTGVHELSSVSDGTIVCIITIHLSLQATSVYQHLDLDAASPPSHTVVFNIIFVLNARLQYRFLVDAQCRRPTAPPLCTSLHCMVTMPSYLVSCLGINTHNYIYTCSSLDFTSS